MDFVLPIAFSLAGWWLSTVVLIYRAGMPKKSYAMTLVGTTVVALLGIVAIYVSRHSVSASGSYLAFFGALAVWGWHEVTYLFGYVNGPRPEPCPPGVKGWQKFKLGLKTCIYHELAVVATVVGMGVLLWNATNTIAFWTFAILWIMRWSAKLNIFLGVRNLHEEFWPEHLAYLKTFVTRRKMNELFPVSVTFSVVGLLSLAFLAVTAGDNVAERTGAMLMATLLALALLEHWFLFAKTKDDVLWRAGMRSRSNGGAAAN